MAGWVEVRVAGALVPVLLLATVWGAPAQKKQNPDRPSLAYNMLGLHRENIDAYDSKGEPVARVTEALLAMNKTGWDLVHEYIPTIGVTSVGAARRVHPEDPADRRFFGGYVNDDPTLSPMPLLCMVWSLPGSQLSGPLKTLHDELVLIMPLEDYSTWQLDELRKLVDRLTVPASTNKGVKYRTPKTSVVSMPHSPSSSAAEPGAASLSKVALSFRQALQLYAMTLALVRDGNQVGRQSGFAAAGHG